MAEQGTLYFCGGDVARIPRVFREFGLAIEITGSTRNWRQIVVASGDATLTLRLKTRRSDPAYFIRQTPHLAAAIGGIPVANTERQTALLNIAGTITGSIGLTAEPRFDAHPDLVVALKAAAHAVDGFFAMSDGFHDAERRALLLNDGTSDGSALPPALPRFAAEPEPEDELPAVEPTAPAPSRVAERMLAMLATGYRALLEKDLPNRAQRKLRRLGDWFWALNVGHELEPHERQMLDAPLGTISASQMNNLALSFEAIAILAWALRLSELPAHDESVDLRSLAQKAGLLSDDARFVIESADVRSPHELREAADHIIAVHWRLNRFEQDGASLDMRHMAAEAWFGHVDSAQLALIDDDLAILGKPMNESCEAARGRCLQITLQRHRAINWLLGHHPVFSRVKTAT